MPATPQGNIAKGKEFERKLCTEMNIVLNLLLMERSIPVPGVPVFQRRQNQSAVGGSDIENPFDLCIEAKAQENLAVNTWWEQCLKARCGAQIPFLIYKQNNKGIKVRCYAELYVAPGRSVWLPVTIEFGEFKSWLKTYLIMYLDSRGWRPTY